jgi:TetR/AcrR family transcriptional repressor of uid operon
MEDARNTGMAELAEIGEGLAMTRAERRDHNVQRILDAARHCFVCYGFQGASMQQICGEAGMSPGALYRYFPSKEAIIREITEADRRDDAELFAAMFENPDVVEGVVEAAMGHIRHVRDRDMAALFAEIRAESTRNEMIRATCMEHQGEISDKFRAYVAGAIERGEIEPVAGIDALMAMFMIVGEGCAINNLLGLGLPESEIEATMRGMAVGMLRPTGRTRKA